MNLTKYYNMATRTFHVSFPTEWAKEIEDEMKKEHFSPTEFFKSLYRRYRSDQQAIKDLEESEMDYRKGRFIEADSLADLIEEK